jgi:hypothetical protein
MFHDGFPAIYQGLFNDLNNLEKWPAEGLCAFASLTGMHWKQGDVVFYGRAQTAGLIHRGLG